MRERKRKRIESLVDKYARKRGMEVPDLVEEANGFAKHEDVSLIFNTKILIFPKS